MHYPASKLPHIGTTIFTVMSQMANDYQAINLSQGFPDFDGPSTLLNAVGSYIAKGMNQYSPMSGILALREQIAAKVARLYANPVSADEVTVTSGATEALFAAIAAVVRAGDEVIMFDPAYDSYEPAVELNGGIAIRLQLQPPLFQLDWAAVKAATTPKTRLIILNGPHNPTGTVLSAADMQHLIELVRGTDILLLGDEVYEHIAFNGQQHQSLNRYPELYERSFVVSSFGKTYHATGWKIGYCVAPPPLTAEFRKMHQYLTFATCTPMQLALADILRDEPEHADNLPSFYQQKRDLFCSLLSNSRFQFTPSAGTYFQVVDYSAISNLSDTAFCEWLTKEVGVAAIPVSVFCKTPPEMRLIRFCFAKGDETLQRAAERLCAI